MRQAIATLVMDRFRSEGLLMNKCAVAIVSMLLIAAGAVSPGKRHHPLRISCSS